MGWGGVGWGDMGRGGAAGWSGALGPRATRTTTPHTPPSLSPARPSPAANSDSPHAPGPAIWGSPAPLGPLPSLTAIVLCLPRPVPSASARGRPAPLAAPLFLRAPPRASPPPGLLSGVLEGEPQPRGVRGRGRGRERESIPTICSRESLNLPAHNPPPPLHSPGPNTDPTAHTRHFRRRRRAHRRRRPCRRSIRRRRSGFRRRRRRHGRSRAGRGHFVRGCAAFAAPPPCRPLPAAAIKGGHDKWPEAVKSGQEEAPGQKRSKRPPPPRPDHSSVARSDGITVRQSFSPLPPSLPPSLSLGPFSTPAAPAARAEARAHIAACDCNLEGVHCWRRHLICLKLLRILQQAFDRVNFGFILCTLMRRRTRVQMRERLNQAHLYS